jgi:hypothetical protein
MTKTAPAKFDAVIGHWGTRILAGVSEHDMQRYCEEKRLYVYSKRSIGLTYVEVELRKVGAA